MLAQFQPQRWSVSFNLEVLLKRFRFHLKGHLLMHQTPKWVWHCNIKSTPKSELQQFKTLSARHDMLLQQTGKETQHEPSMPSVCIFSAFSKRSKSTPSRHMIVTVAHNWAYFCQLCQIQNPNKWGLQIHQQRLKKTAIVCIWAFSALAGPALRLSLLSQSTKLRRYLTTCSDERCSSFSSI